MKRPAFQFYPADWRGSKWVAFDPAGISIYGPQLPACYVVIVDGRAIYVGQAMNFRARMRDHRIDIARYSESYVTPWGQFDSVVVKARFADRFGDWAMRELRLIRRLQPCMNCVHGTRPRKVKVAA